MISSPRHLSKPLEVLMSDARELGELQVPVPQCECERLKILRETRLMDTEDETDYNRYVQLAARIFKVSKIVCLW